MKINKRVSKQVSTYSPPSLIFPVIINITRLSCFRRVSGLCSFYTQSYWRTSHNPLSSRPFLFPGHPDTRLDFIFRAGWKKHNFQSKIHRFRRFQCRIHPTGPRDVSGPWGTGWDRRYRSTPAPARRHICSWKNQLTLRIVTGDYSSRSYVDVVGIPMDKELLSTINKNTNW
jgi:hypothetical protein